ncbi:hypothetical protein ACQR2B_31015 [Bradyrhizobium oligotrophicum]|uniref:hypothetical protein n=1 Tax=Bradyrhizobium TaxID=374 RepID=UPI003EBF6C14
MEDAERTLNNFLNAEARPYAVHEAGHAVVARALGGDVLLVEMDSFTHNGGKMDCRTLFTVVEDLAVCIAGCGAEHLLDARTSRAAKAGDRARVRKLLAPLPEAEGCAALAEAYRLANEKLMANADGLRMIADELMRKSIKDRVVRIERDQLLLLLDGSLSLR